MYDLIHAHCFFSFQYLYHTHFSKALQGFAPAFFLKILLYLALVVYFLY